MSWFFLPVVFVHDGLFLCKTGFASKYVHTIHLTNKE
jgi:hypothetical protein